MLPDDKLPKYYQLKKVLIEKINQDEFRVGELIPSERELMAAFDVSRITVRRAVEELANEGYLYKVQGKGTYVKSDQYRQDLISITSCTQDVINLGMTPSRKVLSSTLVVADKKRGRFLQLGEGERVFRLERIYYADGEPVNHTITYLPCKLFPGLETHNFSQESLYETLEKQYGTQITKATRTVEAIIARDEIAEYLNVEPGVPVLRFVCTTHGIVGGKEQPIETFRCCYRSDRFQFYINQVK